MDENKDLETEETEKAEPEVVVPPKRDYEDELLGIIQSDLSPEEKREKLADYHDNDIASVFGLLTEADRRKLYRVLSDDEISDIFSYLDNVEDYIAELDAEKAADMAQKMAQNRFTLDDFLDQLQEMRKMGDMKEMLSMIPGMGKQLKNVQLDEKQLTVTESIIQSMTKQERENPALLNSSRKKRIAAGSGRQVQDVNRLLKQFEQVQSLMKRMTAMQGGSGKAGKKGKKGRRGFPGMGGFPGLGGGFPGL